MTKLRSNAFGRLIGTGIGAKLPVDIGVQIFNPFLPIIAAGLGLDVVALGRLVGLRSAMGIFAPAAGVASDRSSYRLVIRLALLVNAAGFLLLAVSQNVWMVGAAMLLAGLGASSFTPTLQAYISGQLPYALRARGLGMIEYSWALTGIVGLSLVGLLIQFTGWRAPFVLLAAGMVVMSYVYGRMPAAAEHRKAAATAGAPKLRVASFAGFFHLGRNARSTYATMAAGALSSFGAMQITIAHGAWLESQYGLTPVQLGLVAFVFGWFDLAASVSVSLFTDRIGKRRSVLWGIAGSLAGYLAMPFLNSSVVNATLAIAVARMCYEFNIVSHFPLLSEQVPDQRGKVLTLGASVKLIGGTLAGFTGPWLLVNAGVAPLALSSAASVLLAMIVVLTLVREQGVAAPEAGRAGRKTA